MLYIGLVWDGREVFCDISANDFVCDTTQLANRNRTTVNLPVSLLIICYFPNTLSVLSFLKYFDSIQYSFSVLSLNGLLVVYDPLHLISTWFAWISQRIS